MPSRPQMHQRIRHRSPSHGREATTHKTNHMDDDDEHEHDDNEQCEVDLNVRQGYSGDQGKDLLHGDDPPGSVRSEITDTTYNLLPISLTQTFSKPNDASPAQVKSY